MTWQTIYNSCFIIIYLDQVSLGLIEVGIGVKQCQLKQGPIGLELGLNWVYCLTHSMSYSKVSQWYCPDQAMVPLKLSNDTAKLGSGTNQTQSPKLCQVVVPSSISVLGGSTIRLGDGTANISKSQGFKFWLHFLKSFEAYKYPTHPYLVKISTENKN